MEIAQSPHYMDIVQFIISYIRENRKYIPPADFIYDYPEQLDKNYTLLLSTLDGPNYGLWLSELYKEAQSMGLEVTNQLLIDALAHIHKEKDSIISYTRLFIDLLRWCDGWTNPSYDISDYDQQTTNFHLGYVIGQVHRIIELQQASIPSTSKSQKTEKKGIIENAANVASIASLIVSLIFGLPTLFPDPQIAEQNRILTEQNELKKEEIELQKEKNELQKEENRILAGIWYEQQKDNDNLVPSPTPECTSEPWLST